MRFSVITVTRNSAPVLPRALASLRQQTLKDFEWVVVDGASEDDTVAIAKAFEVAPLQLVSERDSGIYDAMNKAVHLARGEYLYFLNSDDRLAGPRVLEQASRQIDEAGRPDLLVGRVRYVGVEPTVLRDFSHITVNNLLFDSLCHQATFARRELFTRFGVFDTGFRFAADLDWFARVMRGGARLAFSTLTIANFSADGAHVRAEDVTRAERALVLRRHTKPLERLWTKSLAWTRYKGRRLVGLQAKGRLMRIDIAADADFE